MIFKLLIFLGLVILRMTSGQDDDSIIEAVPYVVGGLPAINGNQTHPGEFPFMAALGWINYDKSRVEFMCGGMLISSNMILTAAHCVYKNGKLVDVVYLGGNPLTEYKPFGNFSSWVQYEIIYPYYDPNQSYHDIALLKISNHHPLDQKGFQPICLWDGKDLTNSDAIAIGYGLTEFAGKDSQQLLKVVLQIFSSEYCEPFYKHDKTLKSGISNGHICAGDKDGVKDTCQGDSGGPLIVNHNGKHYAVGITSTGQACSGDPPAIYTKIAPYIKWISKALEYQGDNLESCN